MSKPSVLIEKIQKRREFHVELVPAEGSAPQKRVLLRRPPEAEWQHSIGLDYLCRYTHGWSGFTEADLYAGGGSDEVEFDAALWREVLADRADWIVKCADAVVQAMTSRAAERKAAEGN